MTRRRQAWINVAVLLAFLLFAAPWLLLIDSGKPTIVYRDVPVPSEPQTQIACPVPAVPVCEPKLDSVWPEPSDMPTPWKVIPKPGLPKSKLTKPRLAKRHISKPIEYIDANGTRFYPMDKVWGPLPPNK
jgi:hypothetical protein